MNRVVHFELPVSDPEVSIKFYSQLFGWQFHKWDGSEEYDYWLITTGTDGEGINGGLMRRHHPAQPVACTVDVADIDAVCVAVEAAGGKIVVPKTAVPGIGWLAYFEDPDGLVSGVMQPDPTAGQ